MNAPMNGASRVVWQGQVLGWTFAEKTAVVVAVPSSKSWQPGTGMCLAGMCALSARKGIGLGILFLQGAWVSKARNILVRQAIDSGADYVMFVDDDMVFPPEALERLLAHQKDIVGVRYSHRAPPFGQVGVLLEDKEEGLALAEVLGTGLILIKTTVFAQVPQPWFVWTETRSEDAYFIEKARGAGLGAWCDLDLSKEIGHIGSQVFMLRAKPDEHGRSLR